MSVCPGDKITTKFMYEDPSIKFMNLSAVNWFYKKVTVVCYYSKDYGFKVRMLAHICIFN